jgi:hypothetical protein
VRLVGEHEQRRLRVELRAVTHLVRPAIRAVNNIEQAAAHYQGAGGLDAFAQDGLVNGVVVEGPGVQRLAALAHALL